MPNRELHLTAAACSERQVTQRVAARKRSQRFITISTYRLVYPACCGLAKPGAGTELLSAANRVDSLPDYTAEMWGILTDVVLQEWFGLRLPPSRVPWDGPTYLPDKWRLLYCLDRTYARQAMADIYRHYLSKERGADAMSIFAGYGLTIPDGLARERDGLVYLARQALHFRSLDDYLFIIQETQTPNCPPHLTAST